ncbi:MAG TPA: class I SAM-dependent methyltransferase family protein, partial [Thermoplasmatales archaeon]|nr:class I SAM-dependent methyltransferase family protein [Thermoplasmatales archaeon]
MKKSIAVKIEISKGEEVKRRLSKEGLIRGDLLVKRDENHLLIPVKQRINEFEIVEDLFEEVKSKPRSYLEVVNVPEKVKPLLPKSFDIVGDIVLIKIPPELIKYKNEIGRAILEVHKNISAVFLSKPIKGEYRVREIEFIAGIEKTRTLHKEYGIELEVDVKEVFFSPRLAGERYRVARATKSKDIVVDMFAGVGSFSIMIAKYSSPYIVYAIDKNPVAISLAKRNAARNKVLDKVEIIEGDAREIIHILSKKGVRADRIIMNLPFSAYNFFGDALSIANNNCVIHYYDILKEEDIENRIGSLKKIAKT